MLAQAGEAIERAEQGKGLVLVSQFPKPNSEVRQLTWPGAGRRSRGNPPKKRKPCKRASAGVVRLPCRPTCCHSGGHPVYYRYGAEGRAREQEATWENPKKSVASRRFRVAARAELGFRIWGLGMLWCYLYILRYRSIYPKIPH